MELRELISRGRFVFSNAPKKLEVFDLINGRRSTKEIALQIGRSLSSVLNDTKELVDMGLIEPKTEENGEEIKVEGCAVYQKVPPLRHVPLSYFKGVSKGSMKVIVEEKAAGKRGKASLSPIAIPSENEILDICKHGEDQLYEFKAPGVETDKITKEIAGFSNTRRGGLILYGVDDDGSVIGSDKRRQDLDQSLQNSIRNTISPQLSVRLEERAVLGYKIIIVLVPPWDRKNIYQYKRDMRVYIRKGSNIFAATPEELGKLGKGEYVV